MRALEHGLAAVAAAAALPVVVGAVLVRPRWGVGLGERLGAAPRVEPGSVWIHAASVGEIRASLGLVDRLRTRGRPVFTSTSTLAGREAMRHWRPDVPCHLAPLDHPWCVESSLRRVAPAALVLVETELWPSWIAAAHRRGVPVLLVSGRVSDRSFPRYRRIERIVAPALRRLRAVGARTSTDGERLCALGAPREVVSVTGDLKLDLEDTTPPLASDLERVLGGVPLLVAGSTHAGEEWAALEALAAAERAGIRAALVIAPRHPERFTEVKRLVRVAGRAVRRRTRVGEASLAPGEVLVLDTVGELSAVYARAAVAFVGGTLVPIGGHNVLEPAQAGRPVLFGRHTDNIRHAVEILEGCGAGRCVESPEQLARAVADLLADPEAARAAGEAGRQALRIHRGSAERTEKLVETVLTSAPRA